MVIIQNLKLYFLANLYKIKEPNPSKALELDFKTNINYLYLLPNKLHLNPSINLIQQINILGRNKTNNVTARFKR